MAASQKSCAARMSQEPAEAETRKTCSPQMAAMGVDLAVLPKINEEMKYQPPGMRAWKPFSMTRE
ncbi:hypothetical protein ACLBXM_00920 [Xanthobacteraceae bacterium A53D]